MCSVDGIIEINSTHHASASMRTEVGHFLDIIVFGPDPQRVPFVFILLGIFLRIVSIVNIYQLINIDVIYII